MPDPIRRLPGAGWRPTRQSGVPSRPSIRRHAIVAQDQQAIEKLKRNCWHHEQIHRHNPISVIAEKLPPALRRWSPPTLICPMSMAESPSIRQDPRARAHGFDQCGCRSPWPAGCRGEPAWRHQQSRHRGDRSSPRRPLHARPLHCVATESDEHVRPAMLRAAEACVKFAGMRRAQ